MSYAAASMRPPDLPGGNTHLGLVVVLRCPPRFNEAAGFTRRKLLQPLALQRRRGASMRPPDLPGGNRSLRARGYEAPAGASMRPPDLPGGNESEVHAARISAASASMRPPDLPGGNSHHGAPLGDHAAARRFNEAAGFTRRKPGHCEVGDRQSRHASMRPPDLPGGNDAVHHPLLSLVDALQ